MLSILPKILPSSWWVIHIIFSNQIDDIDFTGDSLLFFALSVISFTYMCANLLALYGNSIKGKNQSADESKNTKIKSLDWMVSITGKALALDVALGLFAVFAVKDADNQSTLSALVLIAGVPTLIAFVATVILSLTTKLRK